MQFEWVDFYSDFALQLLSFKNNRELLISKVNKVYASISESVSKPELMDEITDIDPFTVFGFFHREKEAQNRNALFASIAKEFQIEKSIPSNFDGVPLLDESEACFFDLESENKEDEINHLWNLYVASFALIDEDNETNREEFSKWFDIVRDQPCVSWNLTVGLYLAHPYDFMNLDLNNREFLKDENHMPKEFVEDVETKLHSFPKAVDYLYVINTCKDALDTGLYEYKNFIELSYFAWAQENSNATKKKTLQTTELRWFRPIIEALKDLGGSATPAQVREKISENEQLTEEELAETRGKTNVNRFANEVAFARYHLVNTGYIDNSVHGIWTLTDEGKRVNMTDEYASDVLQKSINSDKKKTKRKKKSNSAIEDEGVQTTQYWLYSPGDNASMWDEFYDAGIMAIKWGEIDDLRLLESPNKIKEKMQQCIDPSLSFVNASNIAWQFANEMRINDVVFAFKGDHQIIGRGVVTSDYNYDAERKDEYAHYRNVSWTHKGEWDVQDKMGDKSLEDITVYTERVTKLKELFKDNSKTDVEEKEKNCEIYGEKQFFEEVYMEQDNYEKLVGLLDRKKNVILQGSPGVGKTFLASKLAYSIMGEKDPERVMMVQFHQSYSYEDFIMGYRPCKEGFELKKGVFYHFCKKAEDNRDKKYFFIIDEINRGNLSKIFGELFMLIESDKRGKSLQLLYSDERFNVPDNVYIIGMMNTADRSLAMLDYALRRRFAFFDLKPGFKTVGFRKYQKKLNNQQFDDLIDHVQSLNEAISKDDSLGEGFCIGHSYFCGFDNDKNSEDNNPVDEKKLKSIVEYELIPLLKEYWFDDPGKVNEWAKDLRSVFNDSH